MTQSLVPEGHEHGEIMSFGQKIFYRFLWVLVQLVSRGYFRMRARGFDNVPEHGSYILAPVHRSNLDTPLVAAVTRRRLRFMGKESLWKSRFGSWFFTAGGGFPVRRGSVDRRALRACINVVGRGEPLVMFPEGTRQFGPVIEKMFDGPAYVACRAQVPVVPVGIGGSERAMGKGTKMPHPTRMTLVVGEPMIPPSPDEGSKRVSRRAVQAFSAELKIRLQQLFDEAQEMAGTPNTRR